MLTFMSKSSGLQFDVILNSNDSRTGRMQAKGCAKPMTWQNARRHFYWSLRGRLARERALAEMSKANPNLSHESMVDILNDLLPAEDLEPRTLAEHLESLNLEATLSQLRSKFVSQQISTLASLDRKALVSGMTNLLGKLSEDEKAAVLLALHPSSPNGEFQIS
jgi:acetyl-CoA carboxylase/biotin carboxylase 1